MYLWKNVLFTHLHNRLEVAWLVRSVEWLYHSHPEQPNQEADYCQYQSRLADKVPKGTPTSRGFRSGNVSARLDMTIGAHL
jgi:hypothetical protein